MTSMEFEIAQARLDIDALVARDRQHKRVIEEELAISKEEFRKQLQAYFERRD